MHYFFLTAEAAKKNVSTLDTVFVKFGKIQKRKTEFVMKRN